MRKKEFPKISFVLCTYYGERTLKDCLRTFFEQDYPKDKLELLIADGGSKDKTIEIIKYFEEKYPSVVSFMHNDKQFADGKGMGIDNTSRKTKYEIIGFIDQDNIFPDKNWIKKMVAPLVENEKISAVQSQLLIPEEGSWLDKYFGAIGVEDPFAIPYSLTAQVALNPGKFEYKEKGDYYEHKLSRKKYLYGGNNGCLVRRDDFFAAGGYNQDNDEFYRFALKEYIVAVPKNARLHHWSSVGFKHFLIKRGKYVLHYLTKNYGERDMYWFDLKKNQFDENFKFIRTVLFNLLVIPGAIQGVYLSIKKRQAFWLIHPIMLFSITLDYIIGYFYAKINSIFKKEVKLDMSKQNKGK